MRSRLMWSVAVAAVAFVLASVHPGGGLIGTSPAFGKDGGGGSSGGSGSGGSGSGSGGSGSGSSGSSGGSGSGSGSSDGGGSGSGGSGSSGSGDGDHSGPGGGGDAGSGGSGGGGSRSGDDRRNGELELVYPDGFKEEIRHGVLELTDPAGRTVIKRAATSADYARFRKKRR